MKQPKGEKLVENLDYHAIWRGYRMCEKSYHTVSGLDKFEKDYEESKTALINYIKKLENMNTKMRKELKK